MNSEDNFIDPTVFGDSNIMAGFDTDNIDLHPDELNLPLLSPEAEFEGGDEARDDAAFLMQLEAVGNFMLADDDQEGGTEPAGDSDGADTSNLPMSYIPTAADLTDMHQDLAELDASLTTGRMSNRGQGGRKRGKLTPEGQRLLGQANEFFLNGNYADAIKNLQEVIRLCPNAFEPYNTLGMIYDEQGESDKAIIFLMVAAHLKQSDTDLWRRVAQLSKDLNNAEQAIYCYGKIIGIDGNDENALWERATICLQANDLAKAAEGFSRLLAKRPHDLALAQDVAKIYVDLGALDKAITVFETALEATTEKVSFDQLNIVAELYIMVKDWQKAFQLIENYGVANVEGKEEALPLDLRVKYYISGLYLDNPLEIKNLFNSLSEYATSQVSDLYVEISLACYECKHYNDALTALRTIEKELPDYEVLYIQTQIAACLRGLGQHKEAIECLQTVLEMYPNHRETRLTMAEIYDELGLEAEANEVRSAVIVRRRPSRSDILPKVPGLDEEDNQAELARNRSLQSEDVEETAARVRDRYTTLLDLCKDDGLVSAQTERFRRIARSLVTEFQSCDRFYGEKRLRPFRQARGGARRKSKKKSTSNVVVDDSEEEDYDSSAAEGAQGMDVDDGVGEHLGLNFDEWFYVHEVYAQLLVRIAEVAVETLQHPLDDRQLTSRQASEASKGWLSEALNTLNMATRANIFYYNKKQMMTLKLLIIAVGLRLNDEASVYESIRWFLREYRDVNDFCALYGAVIRGPNAIDQYRQANSQKFFIRQIDRTGNNNPFYLTLQGHVFALTGSSSHALLCFGGSQQMRPDDALAAFNLALGFLHRGIQRSTKNRHYAFMQGFAFLQQYAELRMNDSASAIPRKYRQQECMFNMGRAMHTVNVVHLAVHFYRRALLISDQIPESDTNDDYDLRMEAAYNLAQIYVESGARDLAKKLYERYCIF